MRIRIIYGTFVEILPSAVLESNQVTNATIREVQLLVGDLSLDNSVLRVRIVPLQNPYVIYDPNLFLVEVFSELVSDVVYSPCYETITILTSDQEWHLLLLCLASPCLDAPGEAFESSCRWKP